MKKILLFLLLLSTFSLAQTQDQSYVLTLSFEGEKVKFLQLVLTDFPAQSLPESEGEFLAVLASSEKKPLLHFNFSVQEVEIADASPSEKKPPAVMNINVPYLPHAKYFEVLNKDKKVLLSVDLHKEMLKQQAEDKPALDPDFVDSMIILVGGILILIGLGIVFKNKLIIKE